MKYENISPVLYMNFKSANRAHPSLLVERADTALQLLNPTGYSTMAPNTPHMMLDEFSLNPSGLRCEAARQIVAGNSMQDLNSNNVPIGSTFYGQAGESMFAVGSGYENGIHYVDFQIISSMPRGYFDYYPFGIFTNIGKPSCFSMYVKKISGSFPNAVMTLLNRTQLPPNTFDDQMSTQRSIDDSAKSTLVQSRLAVAKGNPLIPGYTKEQLISSCILLLISATPISGVLRIGYPQWEVGTNPTPPIPSSANQIITRAATKYRKIDLPSFGDSGCFCFEFICPNPETEWQTIVSLADQLFGANKAVGVSLENTNYLRFVVGAATYRMASPGGGARCRVAINWGKNANSIVLNGALIATIAEDTSFIPKSIQLGAAIGETTSATHYTGSIGSVTIYPKQLSVQAMASITK